MKYTIFSIDDQASPTLRQSFEFMFKRDKRTKGNLIPLSGCYKGVKENSYICLSVDFNSFVQPMGFVANQQSILRMSECNKKYTVLVELSGGAETHLGCMKSVRDWDLSPNQDYSYRPDIDTFFIVVNGNNDHYPCITSGVSPEETRRFHAERCEARRVANA